VISGLSGKLEALGGDWAIVNISGISFQVFMPTSTLSQLGAVGGEVKLYTHLHLREDNVSLFGFASAQELNMFKALLNVSGLGPRLALAMLSAMDTEQLVVAIASGNADILTSIPGIGNKMANRLVLELKDKLGAGLISSPMAELAQDNADVLAALTALGYSAAESTRALATLPRDQSLSLEEKVRLALAYFGGK